MCQVLCLHTTELPGISERPLRSWISDDSRRSYTVEMARIRVRSKFLVEEAGPSGLLASYMLRMMNMANLPGSLAKISGGTWCTEKTTRNRFRADHASFICELPELPFRSDADQLGLRHVLELSLVECDLQVVSAASISYQHAGQCSKSYIFDVLELRMMRLMDSSPTDD